MTNAMEKTYQNKKVLILGLGTEGDSMARFLVQEGAKVTVGDRSEKEQLDLVKVSGLEDLGVNFHCGEDYLSCLNEFEAIFRSPGVKRLLPELVEAEENGVEITSQTKLFFDRCPGKIIGVTGTKGKGTTTTLIGEILKNSGRKVFIGGNIGHPSIEFLNQIDADTWVVLELSSFQLQDLEKSPHIGVVLMVTSEHQDYHATTAEYIQAKESIVKFQNEKDFAVVNADFPASMAIGELAKGEVYYYSRKIEVKRGAFARDGEIYLKLPVQGVPLHTKEFQLRGEHNWENVMAAVLAAFSAGADINSIREAVVSFKGLEHRLELVREVDGVRYYNDSFSTTPETAIAAMKSFEEPTIQILGGSEKGSDYTELGEEVVKSRNLKAVILIGAMAEKIEKAIVKAGKFEGQVIKGAQNMAEIVSTSQKLAKPGDVVVLSPACASFGMFKNYKDRGSQFKEVVNQL